MSGNDNEQAAALEYERYFASADTPQIRPEAFYGILRDIVAAAVFDSEATPTAVALNVMAQFAARFGRIARICIGDDIRQLRFYSLVVGLSSRGRKGVSATFPKRLFKRIDEKILSFPGLKNCPALSRPRIVNSITSGEGVIQAICDESEVKDKLGKPLHAGIRDKRLLIDLSEFAMLLTIAARVGNTASVILRDAFDGCDLQTLGRVDPVAASNPHICIAGSITPVELLERLAAVEVANGLMNRFVVGYSMREKFVPIPNAAASDNVDSLAKKMLSNVAKLTGGHAILTHTEPLHSLTFDGETVPIWKIYYEEMGHYEYASPVCEKLCSRIEFHTWNIAAILALMNGETAISRDALFAAKAWTDYSKETIEFLFASREAVAEARILANIGRKALESVTKREGLRVPWVDVRDDLRRLRLFSDERMEAAVDRLVTSAPPQIYMEIFTRTGSKPIRLLSLPRFMAELKDLLPSESFPGTRLEH